MDDPNDLVPQVRGGTGAFPARKAALARAFDEPDQQVVIRARDGWTRNEAVAFVAELFGHEAYRDGSLIIYAEAVEAS